MAIKSVSLIIPDHAPYDGPDSWFESFVGNDLLPVIERSELRRFWFSRYGAVGSGKHILFRFETDDLQAVEAQLEALRSKFSLGPEGYTDYDYPADIGRGAGSRFLGSNSRHQDHGRRGEVAFDFLHASARLFLDCLSGPDAQGYFRLERERTSGFSVETSMEQFHHLFCNMTGVPTFIVIASRPGSSGHHLMSYHQFKGETSRDPTWRLVDRFPVVF